MTLYLNDPDVTIHQGDSLAVLRTLPSESVHMCVTSPPFYGLRDYGTGEWEGGNTDCDHMRPSVPGKMESSTLKGRASNQNHEREPWRGGNCGKCGARRVDQQIGLEQTPDEWADRLVQVFREVRRVLRHDGTLWLEVGDSYMSGQGGRQTAAGLLPLNPGRMTNEPWNGQKGDTDKVLAARDSGLKPKDLVGGPWMLAFALRNDGWYLRSDIIWHRPNPMPESVTDRPTKAHSYVFLLAKSPRYFWDADAIREESIRAGDIPGGNRAGVVEFGVNAGWAHGEVPTARNRRSVWTIPTEPLPFDHYAAYPQKLVEPCVLAGTSERGVCAGCGAPWERETEKPVHPWSADTRTPGAHTPVGQGKPSGAAMQAWINANPTLTLGWRPTCACNTGTVPATVLDPFLGSGTSAIVARRLGRRCVGIELNAKYAELAASRLAQQSLFAEEVA